MLISVRLFISDLLNCRKNRIAAEVFERLYRKEEFSNFQLNQELAEADHQIEYWKGRANH